MRSFVALLLAVFLTSYCHAGDCRLGASRLVSAHSAFRTSHAAISFTLVPFAVPVAVPVAVVQQPAVVYGYAPSTSAAYAPQATAGEVGSSQSSAAAEASDSQSLVTQRCASCHGGTAPKAGFDLSRISAVDAQHRLESVARVVSDDSQRRMPPGEPLSPQEIGRLVQELSQ